MRKEQLFLYWNTLRFMKIKQINYRVFYTLRNKIRNLNGFSYSYIKVSKSQKLLLVDNIESINSYSTNGQMHKFTFLNLEHSFKSEIDWNFADHGKLWTYNLNYFEYLNQEKIDIKDGLKLIHDFILNIEHHKDALEPFPIALRGINWIKFLSKNKISDQSIDDSLYAQYYILMDNLEYHLLGNHLLENGFSLLFGAYYFNDEHLYKKAKEILKDELEEQILSDGAHFELAPMYHQIMLFRLLDCINLCTNNKIFEDSDFQEFLIRKASLMLGWLQNITYQNGNIPHFNDSTDGIAPTSYQLFGYAQRLDVPTDIQPLKESEYRKYSNSHYELVVDVGNIGPDYIPGHAHSDTFNFELYINNQPAIIDTGISTYEANDRRRYERSTSAHNTIEINGIDQSEVWSSFRVARRAKIIDIKTFDNGICATHDGYKRLGVLHSREFYVKEKTISVTDTLTYSNSQTYEAVAYLHFAPGIILDKTNENTIITNNAIYSFEGLQNLEIVDISIAEGYNKLRTSKGVKVFFQKQLHTLVKVIV